MSRLDKYKAAVSDLKARIIKAEAWSGGCAIDWMMREDAKKIRTILEYHGVWDGAPRAARDDNPLRICHRCGHYLSVAYSACPHCGTQA